MKVVCERCGARLEFDRSRLGATGAPVRCPHCKHAFFVTRPGQSRDALLEEAALDAARRAEPLPPSVVQDLPPEREAGGAPEASAASKAERPADAASSAGEDPENESDWEFDADFPIGEEEGGGNPEPDSDAPGESDPLGSLLGERETGVAADAAEASELEELGEPDTWDLLSPLPRPPSEPAGGAPQSPQGANEASSPEEGAELTTEADPESGSGTTEVAPTPRRLAEAPELAVRAGWAASVALVALGLLVSLLPLPAPPPVLTGSQTVAGLQVVGLRGSFFADPEVGPLYVIRGELVNPGLQARRVGAPLRLELFPESVTGGRKLEAAVGWALASSEPVPWELLRDPRKRARELAEVELAPGEGIPFAAVVRGEATPPLYARIEPESGPPTGRAASKKDDRPESEGTPPSGGGERSDSTAASPAPAVLPGASPVASEGAP